MPPIKKIPRSKQKKKGIIRSHPFVFTVIAVLIGLLVEGAVSSGVDYVCDKTYKYFSSTAMIQPVDQGKKDIDLTTEYNTVVLNDSKAMVFAKLKDVTPKQRSYLSEQGTAVEIMFFPMSDQDVTIRFENNQVTYISTSQGVPFETCMLKADKEQDGDPFIVPIDTPKVEENQQTEPDAETHNEPVIEELGSK